MAHPTGLVPFAPPEHLRGAPPPPGVVDLPRRYNVAVDLVEGAASERPDAAALVDAADGAETTYAALAEAVARTGGLFAELGARREDRVVVIADDAPGWVAALLGAMRVGLVAVPLSTLLPRAAVEPALDLTRPRVIVTDRDREPLVAELAAELPTAPRVVVLDADGDGWDARLAAADPVPAADTFADESALVLFTSGTTGRQKGAVHAQRDLAVARCFADLMGYGPRDRLWATSKLFFAYALGSTLAAGLSAGASVVVNRGRVTPEVIADVTARTRPTALSSVPSLYARLVHADVDPDAFSSLRYAISAGESLPPEVAERFRRRFGTEIHEHLGATEYIHPFLATPPGAARRGSVGRVVPGVEALVVDGDRLAATGEPGDLWVRGPSVMDGYLHRREATQRALAHGWLRVGDVVEADADGYLTVRGRSDDLFMSSGMKVSPVEVEAQLVEHEAVQEVAVIGGPAADGLTRPWAFVVPTATAAREGLDEELRRWAAERLPRHEAPRWIVLVDELPRTVTGKVRRFRLVEEAAALHAATSTPDT